MNEFCSVDTETTGFGPQARIVEIAAVRYRFTPADGWVEVARFAMLVNPGVPIPERAIAVHGITDEMVKNAPTVADALPRFLEFVGPTPMVAHNAGFDTEMIDQELERIGGKGPIPNAIVCTLRMSRASLQLASHRLERVAEHLGVVPQGAHRALADALTAGVIYQKLVEAP